MGRGRLGRTGLSLRRGYVVHAFVYFSTLFATPERSSVLYGPRTVFLNRKQTMIVTILVILLIFFLLGGGYGYRSGNNILAGGGGLLGLILVVLIIMFLLGHISV